ncbi:hypothetical protein DL93DRAFT_2223884 [Clavulina sp. PMI_390]|nr:hypothetical protein DL93DRAFT_2223884 [Clavulina sp. PMI_390]
MDSESDPRVLRNKLKRAREKIASLRERNAQLEATIKELKASQTDETSSDTEDSDSEGLPTPWYDREDGCYRCAECGFEVCDWVCQSFDCAQEHEEADSDDAEEYYPYYNSMTTEDDLIISDRQMAPRGDTPILQDAVDASEVHRPFEIPSEHYSQLIGRGASREMIQQFQLSYDEQTGIFAWADQDLFDMYSSSLMAEGDTWKIALGRQIVRNYDDLDGSIFMEDLLDEILECSRPNEWETVKEGDDCWITRPIQHAMDLGANDPENTSDYDSLESDLERESSPEYEEDLCYKASQALLLNPLQLHDGYESSESDGDDTSESDADQPMPEVEGLAVGGLDSDTDWSAKDPTEEEEARRDARKSVDGGAGGVGQKDGEDAEMQDASESDSEGDSEVDELSSDEPGSDWDSNDGIE